MHPSPTQVAALFAGIGGIEAGLHRAGLDTGLLCEIDAGAVAVLEERFPGVPIQLDVAGLKTSHLKGVDLLTAGFPCQDLSQAGQTKGMGGDQSSLVLHVFRLLERRRVPWVMLENVPFMLQLGRGHALAAIVSEFERLGYHWAYRVIDSRAFGLPQRRQRIYFLAARNDDPRTILFSGNEPPEPVLPSRKERAFGFYWTEGSRGLGWAPDAVPTLKGGSTVGIASPPAIWLPDGRFIQPDIRDAERMQGFDADWTAPAETVARTGHRWKLVGNAVTVNVAEWIGQQFGIRSGRTDLSSTEVAPERSWPRVAWNVGEGRRTTTEIGAWPVARASTPLPRFLEWEGRPLSERATRGFLSRFRKSTLTRPEGFLEALEAHLRSVSGEDSSRAGAKNGRRSATAAA